MSRRVARPGIPGSEEIRAARPAGDALHMEAVRARAEQALFGGAPPATVGRYVLLGHSSDGGMGVVHAAYDPELDRKVALKVLHPRHRLDERARERLTLEARALAKLDHPNVVRIHDVVTHDDEAVIVMEWIDGHTLAAWERERSRSWHEVLSVYAQAGRGLAAAHGVGVVHRDFKPSNAILGDDGRVRVLDFGLARWTVEATPATPGEPPAVDTELTRTGDVVGTVAFCAPEQLAGEPATPASDQFSFGVSLHRALEGIAPFRGEDARELASSIRARTIELAGDGRRVPAWLRAAVARMLAADGASRFASMDAVLVELTRPRGWARWRFVVLAAALALVPAGLALAHRGNGPADTCNGGASEAALVWNAGERVRVAAALDAAGTRYAREIRERVLRGVDDYRDRWVALHRDACEAHRRGEQSAALLDRRMRCMQQHLADLRATVGVLGALDRTTVDRAVDVVARMPAVEDCADLARLEAEHPAPSGWLRRAAVAAIRAGISRAAALERAGRLQDALGAATEALARARGVGYPPVAAEAALMRGRVLMTLRDWKPATEALAEARSIALEHRMFAVAVEAAARAIYIEGTSSEAADRARVGQDAAVFLPLSKGLESDHFARPLLLNNLGAVRMADGDRAGARSYFEDARDALAGTEHPDLELTCIDRNLAMVTADAPAREALIRGVWERLRTRLGDVHVSTLDALDAYAHYVAEPARASRLLRQVCRGFDAFHPQLVERRVLCASYLAFLTGLAGDRAEELRLYDEVVALAATSQDDEIRARGAIATGYTKLLTGDAPGAIAAWARVVASDAGSRDWWIRVRAAHAEVGIAEAELVLGDRRAATSHLQAAIAVYRDAARLNEESEHKLRLHHASALLRGLSAAAPKAGNAGASRDTRR